MKRDPFLAELPRPDDFHVHLRDGAVLEAAVNHTALQFGRALVMPNIQPPVTTTALARAYRDRILQALPCGIDFEPLMALFLTDETTPEEIRQAAGSGVVSAVKLYPAGATTGSAGGVRDLSPDRLAPVLEAMAEAGLPLSVHAETLDPRVDIFDREAVFLERHMVPLLLRVPTLKVVIEHVTTREGVAFVQAGGDRVAATITPHHLRFSRNDLLSGGLDPHLYCLPVLKRASDREALVAAATSGAPGFFAGTDSAPHLRAAKECARAAAGCYCAPAALGLYAEVFDEAGALDRLGEFLGAHGARFYGLPPSRGVITLVKEPWVVPREERVDGGRLTPLQGGRTVSWRVVDDGL